MNWYAQKAKEYYAKWEKAIDSGDTKAADRHQIDYLNYQQEAEKSNKKGR